MAVSQYTSVKSGLTYYAGPHNFNGESYHEYREHNALVIAQIMRGYGWKDNVIAGIFGNMQVESSFNPGAYYGWADYSGTSFGLVQWDPTSKYENWADENGYAPYRDIEYQCERIRLELETGLGGQYLNRDWGQYKEFNITRSEFLSSNESPYWLASVFAYNYERPAVVIDTEKYTDADRKNLQKRRGENAEYWYEIITGGEAPPGPGPDPDPEPTPVKRRGMSLPVFLAATRRRIHVVR